jgi:hypothetical protein
MLWVMFVRAKPIGPYRYFYLVESVRENGRTKQRIIKNLGRQELVEARGDLDRLARSAARLAKRSLVLSLLEDGTLPELACRRIGPPLLFERLWQDTGCAAVLAELLAERAFEFAVERAVFTAVLHRLFAPGSDRACDKWHQDYRIEGAEKLQLHHFYRAMAWLGEELPAAAQGGRTPFAPRCLKDLVEERLFERRRDLFSELSVVFMDTTSLAFTGQGGESLGRHGHSKDHRSDLHQMILGVVVDGAGRPICSEMWPGNVADVGVLLPMVDRLRGRFGVGRVCVVADRGMISAGTIAGLEEQGLEYVLGVRERTDKRVPTVLADARAMVPIVVPRARGETLLEAKEVVIGGCRYILCRNAAEAERDAANRAAILAGLRRQLKKGDKALVNNSAYRRYLKTPARGHFEVDEARVAADAELDGVFVLRTNTKLTPLQAMLRYRELLVVEQLFRTAKALLRTRPIYHQSDAAIRGHVFCSFLALVLRKELEARGAAQGFRPEWTDVVLDLERLQEVEVAQDGKRFLLRTPVVGCAGKLFQATGVTLPPNIRELARTARA